MFPLVSREQYERDRKLPPDEVEIESTPQDGPDGQDTKGAHFAVTNPAKALNRASQSRYFCTASTYPMAISVSDEGDGGGAGLTHGTNRLGSGVRLTGTGVSVEQAPNARNGRLHSRPARGRDRSMVDFPYDRLRLGVRRL